MERVVLYSFDPKQYMTQQELALVNFEGYGDLKLFYQHLFRRDTSGRTNIFSVWNLGCKMMRHRIGCRKTGHSDTNTFFVEYIGMGIHHGYVPNTILYD